MFFFPTWPVAVLFASEMGGGAEALERALRKWRWLFRLGFSRLDGLDKLSGGFTTRNPEEMANFSKIVGKDPTNLPKSSIGNRLSNKIGDYDALRDHYADKREVFITLDTKDYLHITKRAIYFECLGLKIMSPSEFLEKCS